MGRSKNRNPTRATVSAADARRLILQGKGLLDDPARRTTIRTVESMIRRLGFVQLDSINVVERAHHLILLSRLDGYRREHLRRLHESRRSVFEHWTHDASVLPIECFAHWRHRRERLLGNPRVQKWIARMLGESPKKILDAVLQRIEREGPLQSRDFEHEPGSSSAWWGWKPAKAALECLWWRGEVSVTARVNFQKVYDLTERAYPEHHALPAPAEEAFIDFCCREALHRLAVATPRELAEFFGALTPAEAKRWCADARTRGEIVDVSIDSADGSPSREAVALPDWERRAERAAQALASLDGRVRFLSPFDPVIRDRGRAKRLFDFDYRFEAFVPAAKRQYGYYVLPILQGERFLGRADVKLHRNRDELEFKGVWWERGVRQTKALCRAFDDAAERLATFVGAETIATA